MDELMRKSKVASNYSYLPLIRINFFPSALFFFFNLFLLFDAPLFVFFFLLLQFSSYRVMKIIIMHYFFFL